jgi:hypothetical protein
MTFPSIGSPCEFQYEGDPNPRAGRVVSLDAELACAPFDLLPADDDSYLSFAASAGTGRAMLFPAVPNCRR